MRPFHHYYTISGLKKKNLKHWSCKLHNFSPIYPILMGSKSNCEISPKLWRKEEIKRRKTHRAISLSISCSNWTSIGASMPNLAPRLATSNKVKITCFSFLRQTKSSVSNMMHSITPINTKCRRPGYRKSYCTMYYSGRDKTKRQYTIVGSSLIGVSKLFFVVILISYSFSDHKFLEKSF